MLPKRTPKHERTYKKMIRDEWMELNKAQKDFSVQMDHFLDQADGYYKSLNFVWKRNDNSIERYNEFRERILDFYQCFDETINPVFSQMLTAEEKNKAEALLWCVFSFVRFQCRPDEYVFISLRKILDTFETSRKDANQESYANETFYIMYKNYVLPEFEKGIYGDFLSITQEAYDTLFCDPFNVNRMADIAIGLKYAIRFYMHRNDLDYFKDSLMENSLYRMFSECKRRLEAIYINKPQFDEQVDYEQE